MISALTIEENVKNFLENIPKSVTVLAVTKTVSVDDIKIAVKSGIGQIGENKVQEAFEKYQLLKDLNLKWHLIGRLQTNKVKRALQVFDIIHSVDRIDLAEIIDKEAKKINKKQDILLQLNVSQEETKAGFYIKDFFELLPQISKFENISVKGLMTIGSNTENEDEIRNCFRTLRNLKDSINLKKYFSENLSILSMGMTNDYKIAIEEGSTLIRLGRAIFGERTVNK